MKTAEGKRKQVKKKENEKKKKNEKKRKTKKRKQDYQKKKTNDKLPTVFAFFGVFTLLMDLHDCVADPVHTVHILCDARTTPLLLDHTADYIPTCRMRIFPHTSKQHSFGLLWKRREWKSAVSVLIRDN